MPHDKNGELLQVGDRVTLELEIQEIAMTEDYCNMKVKTVEPFYPDTNRFDSQWVNAKQLVKK